MSDNIYNEAYLCGLNQEYATAISEWEYESPYNIYSFKGQPNEYLFDKNTWGIEQFCLIRKDTIIGQVACQFDDNKFWVGWALNPKFCGQGSGYLFISKCVDEIRKKKNYYGEIFLRVAISNKRAVKAYQKAGFEFVEIIQDEIAYTNNVEDFWIMKL